jgi:hypothetical protein
MTDRPDWTKAGMSRRWLLKNSPAFAGAIASAVALPQNAFAQTKLTHEVAKYQDEPKNGQKCRLASNSSRRRLAKSSWIPSAQTAGVSFTRRRHNIGRTV